VKGGVIPIWRTHLIELYHSQLQSDVVRIVDGPMSRKASEQLASSGYRMSRIAQPS
jgi:hypothetical protein